MAGGWRRVLAVGGMLCGLTLWPSAAAHAQVLTWAGPTIFPAVDAAPEQVRRALLEARREHKRVLLDFGGNWCIDCKLLNLYFHESPNAELLKNYFVLVDVNIGNMDANLDIARRYGLSLTGVPVLVVLNGEGRVVYAQGKEFEDMAIVSPSAVTAFLNKWKP